MTGTGEWKVWGIAELGCWIVSFPWATPTGHDAEDCLDAHVRCGIRHIIWQVGRSVLLYHSDIPGATWMGQREDEPAQNAQHRAQVAMRRDRCQLRAALSYAKEKGLVIYGRLCMNRHYEPGSCSRSQFAQNHPEWCEVRKDGWLDSTRLCYAIPEVRRERIEILCEVTRIGCDGLHLDFCRQPPTVRYHPALVNAYREAKGVDPRGLSLSEREAFLDWCRFRAGFVTTFLRELKSALDPFRERYGRPVPVQVRIPNDGFEANIIAGFDVVKWCEEGLIDELALSELQWLTEYQSWSDKPYIELGGKYDIPVYGSSSCLPPQNMAGIWDCEVNPHGVNPLVLARRALKSFEDGAQGIALYQSDTGVRWRGLAEYLAALSDPARLRELTQDQEFVARHPVTPVNEVFGIDNHSLPTEFRADAGQEEDGA